MPQVAAGLRVFDSAKRPCRRLAARFAALVWIALINRSLLELRQVGSPLSTCGVFCSSLVSRLTGLFSDYG